MKRSLLEMILNGYNQWLISNHNSEVFSIHEVNKIHIIQTMQ